ncbi:1,4-alpha-glucan branching protein GlgB [Dermacoccaceae bacterium W4C1]
MALIHQATISPSKIDLIDGWISTQRWYRGTAPAPSLRALGAYRFDDPAGEVGIEIHVLADESGPTPTIYQVPLTYRATPLTDVSSAAFVGTMQHSVLGTRYVYDGAHDGVFATALIGAVLGGVPQAVEEIVGEDGSQQARTPSARVVAGAPAQTAVQVSNPRVLGVEQSNTSLVADLRTDDGVQPVIVKLFRVLQSGPNPDVQVQQALTAAGSAQVSPFLGVLHGEWDDPQGRLAGSGDLAFAQHFLADAPDGWAEATRSAAAGSDPGPEAYSLGRATAALHTALAEQLPTTTASPELIDSIAEGMLRRFSAAAELDPDLAQDRATVETVIQDLRTAQWPLLQRIHGDYHLGQVLRSGNSWVMLDFEGEPLRPLQERNEPDTVLRDVAGMLRSYDYAAGSVRLTTGTDASAWARAARAAFLTGYNEVSDIDLARSRSLLRAYELDKALYELTYEVGHRPDWVPIPEAAVQRLLAAARPAPASPLPDTTTAAAVQHPNDANDAQRGPGSGSGATPLGSSILVDAPAETPKDEESVQDQPASTLDRTEADLLLRGEHRGPHGLLGAHPGPDGVTVRVMRPLASTVELILTGNRRQPLEHEYEGIWSTTLTGTEIPDYRIATTYDDGVEHIADDPYRFLPTLGSIDLHLIGEGRHEQLWTVLGARVHHYPGDLGEVTGTAFAVWAPNARAVRLLGDFNSWDGSRHPMRVLGDSGVWELFVPDVSTGSAYQFSILGPDGVWRSKADPLARQAQIAPQTASVVTDSSYTWNDEQWLRQRRNRDAATGPMSTYEVHLGSWRQGHSYQDLAEHLVNYVRDLGFTHVELMPVMDHPYPPSWGYHVTSYYAPNSRFGDPDDFRALVDTLHQNGIGVILDWVPGHFATDEWALARFDGTALYEHPDPRRGWHPEWGSNIFDFGRPQVRNFLVANALYWMEEFHVDGLRVDGVASMLYLDYARKDGEWEPNIHGGKENLEAVQLLQETNATAYKRVPGIVTIAEESTSWPGVTSPTDTGGLGFGLKWNMGWMHDSLDYVHTEPLYRQYQHHQITFGLTYAFSERFVLPISHDEVVHGKGSLLRKMPGDRWQQLANVRAYLAFMWSHPGKQLLFMGSEFAQESEWADGRSLDWWLLDQPAHWGVHALVKDLNRLYREYPALWQFDHDAQGFTWTEADDASGNTYAYLRRGQDGTPPVAVVLNFSGNPRQDLQIGLPSAGRWAEALNTDAQNYGGSGEGNLGSVQATAEPHHGQPASARVTLGPLSALWLVLEEEDHEGSTTTPEATKEK